VYGIVCCRMPGRPCSRHERTPIVDLPLRGIGVGLGFYGVRGYCGGRSYIVWVGSVRVGFLHVLYVVVFVRCGCMLLGIDVRGLSSVGA
jgi:hypothetical protein